MSITETVDLVHAIRDDFGYPGGWKIPGGYPDSLALCVVDSIQSIGIKYAIVEGVIRRYTAFRKSQGRDAYLDGALELAESFDSLGGVREWIETIGTSNRTFARFDAPLKGAVIADAARMLQSLGINSAADLRAASDDATSVVEAMWRGLPSQRSGVSWRYVLMLAGVEGVKPDRMILSYLDRTMSLRSQPFSTSEAADILVACANELSVSATVLDHRIWSAERIRKSANRRLLRSRTKALSDSERSRRLLGPGSGDTQAMFTTWSE